MLYKNERGKPWKVRKAKEKTQNPTISGRKSGGDKRDRTADLLNAIQALSQLSYTPKQIVLHSSARVL